MTGQSVAEGAGRPGWPLAGLSIVAAWTLVALAWTPPTVLVQQMMRGTGGYSPAADVFLYVLLGFVPWMAATPLILQLGRRFPVSERRVLRPLALHALAGALIVPVTTLAGTLLGTFVMQHGRVEAADLAHVVSAATITSFYSIPTYVAVAAIAQARAYLERYRLRERLLARAQLKALQAQINPHFLFNTLNAISALGYRDPSRADAALSQLSDLIRQALSDRPQEILLKDEIAFAQGYVDLYTLLMGRALNVSFDIEADAWNAAVPSMLLQPLIENAIVHGVAKCENGGNIVLVAHAADGRLALSLVNDAPAAPVPSNGTGIGLANVRERLRAFYGNEQTLELQTGGGKAAVAISLPFRRTGDA